MELNFPELGYSFVASMIRCLALHYTVALYFTEYQFLWRISNSIKDHWDASKWIASSMGEGGSDLWENLTCLERNDQNFAEKLEMTNAKLKHFNIQMKMEDNLSNPRIIHRKTRQLIWIVVGCRAPELPVWAIRGWNMLFNDYKHGWLLYLLQRKRELIMDNKRYNLIAMIASTCHSSTTFLTSKISRITSPCILLLRILKTP